jgi:hypothetical protein
LSANAVPAAEVWPQLMRTRRAPAGNGACPGGLMGERAQASASPHAIRDADLFAYMATDIHPMQIAPGWLESESP